MNAKPTHLRLSGRKRKLHPDCPFTLEEMIAINATLYAANCSAPCLNRPHPSWITAYGNNEEIERKHNREAPEYII